MNTDNVFDKGSPTKRKLSDPKYVGVLLNEGLYYYTIIGPILIRSNPMFMINFCVDMRCLHDITMYS